MTHLIIMALFRILQNGMVKTWRTLLFLQRDRRNLDECQGKLIGFEYCFSRKRLSRTGKNGNEIKKRKY